LADTVLSEFSSTSESGEEVFTATQKENINLKQQLKFVDKIIEKPTEEDLRYLRFYERLDSKRTASWLKNKPNELSPGNRERLNGK
jgi:hypothetical protein